MRQYLRTLLRHFGFDVVRFESNSPEMSGLTSEQLQIISFVRPYTMTSLARIVALIDAVNFVSVRGIEGDIVECGVWRGGSMMGAAMTLLARQDVGRRLFLYDTFKGMSPPGDLDVDFAGISAQSQLEQTERGTGVWCEAGLADVRANMFSTNYPRDNIEFIDGRVEDTIPATVPRQIAVLRLDTDWYESTKHELLHLYPLLSRHGILIVDDYGHWRGAQKAVDEYFADTGERVFLHRVDYTGRLIVRCGC